MVRAATKARTSMNRASTAWVPPSTTGFFERGDKGSWGWGGGAFDVLDGTAWGLSIDRFGSVAVGLSFSVGGSVGHKKPEV